MTTSTKNFRYPTAKHFSYRLWHKYLRIADSLAWQRLISKYPLGCWDDWVDTNPDPVDILIPAIEKDLVILPLVLESLRKNFAHPIREIYIISPGLQSIRDFCKTETCSFIDESDIDCRRPKEINYNYHGLDRSKWLYQQLLKLSNQIGNSSWFFVCDADTALIRRTPFRMGEKTLFYQLSYIHLPYRYHILRLLGFRSFLPLSFVSHMMMFRRLHLEDLKTQIEIRHKRRWDDAILATLNVNEKSSFSEYETYGNFLWRKGDAQLLPAYNKELIRDKESNLSDICARSATTHVTASFHAWMSPN
jgi:hypothetical protein